MFYDEIFNDIMTDSVFSEEASFELQEKTYNVHGFFSSGTYSMQANVAYTPKEGVSEEHFLISLKELTGIRPDSLRGINNFTIKDRGTFRIKDVRGERSGIVNLQLDKVKKVNND